MAGDFDKREKSASEECCCEQWPPGWKPQPQGTWLVIGYDIADIGARPVPNGEVFWQSPSIRVIGGDSFGNPTGGSSVGLEARVANRGSIDAAPVRVDFAFIAPALAIPPAAPETIGTAWTTVPAGQTVDVTCPVEWTPPTFSEDLHACLIVTCSAPGQNDTPTAPANPAADRHVGQRNLTILAFDGEEATMSLQVDLANLGPREGTFQVAVAAAWFPERREGGGRNPIHPHGILAAAQAAAQARSLEEARLWSLRAALLDVVASAFPREPLSERELEGIVRLRWLRGGERIPSSIVAATPPRPQLTSGFMPLGGEVRLAAGQTAAAELEVRVPTGSDHPRLALHLAQISDGRLSGGYTLLIHLTGAESAPQREIGGLMQQGHEIEEEVRRRSPVGAGRQRVVSQVVAQLAGHLPLGSAADLQKAIESEGAIGIGESRHEVADLAPRLPESLFPIADLDDLIRKTDAAVELATTAARRGLPSSHPETAKLAQAVAVAAAAPAPPPAGVFKGPSVFGTPTQQKGD